MKATQKELQFAESLIGRKIKWTRIVRGKGFTYHGVIESLKLETFMTCGLDFVISDPQTAWQMKIRTEENERKSLTLYNIKELTGYTLNHALGRYAAVLN